MIYHVTIGEHTFEVKLGPSGVEVDGETVDVDLAHLEGSAVVSLLLDGDSHRLVAHRVRRGQWELQLRGRRFQAEVLDEHAKAIQGITGAEGGPTGPRPVRAPMPGLVVRVEVAVGDVVVAGQGVAIVEAMKMENELTAEGEGRVYAVHVAQGDKVERDQVLVELVTLDDPGRVTRSRAPERLDA